MTEIMKREDMGLAIEKVMVQGDLAALTPEQRVSYYHKVCESLNLNPYTRPFDYVTYNGKLQLYARKDATEQLRKNHGVSIVALDEKIIDGVYVVTATAQARDGRIDQAKGAVTIEGVKGENKANAIMKAETKAKRRVTLSICGLGWTDESEVDSIPAAKFVTVDQSTGEIIERNQPPRLVKNNEVVTTQPQVTPMVPAEDADIDFGQGDGWDELPIREESDHQFCERAALIMHADDIQLTDMATRLIAKCRELDKTSGDKALSVVKKDGTGSGQYGLLTGKLDRITSPSKGHRFLLSALCGRVISQENPPGWKVKELIDWLQDDNAAKASTEQALKDVWQAVRQVEAVKA